MNTGTKGRKATIACPNCGRLNRVDLSRAKDGPKCGACGRRISLDHPIPLSDQTMDRVLSDAEVPVLVDFYADWCGPCKIIAPHLDAIAADRAGEILVGKLDTDRNPVMAGRYKVRSIPLVVIFSGGREVAREVGAVPRPRLEALVTSVLTPGR
jgi:thioredoxin 2